MIHKDPRPKPTGRRKDPCHARPKHVRASQARCDRKFLCNNTCVRDVIQHHALIIHSGCPHQTKLVLASPLGKDRGWLFHDQTYKWSKTKSNNHCRAICLCAWRRRIVFPVVCGLTQGAAGPDYTRSRSSNRVRVNHVQKVRLLRAVIHLR